MSARRIPILAGSGYVAAIFAAGMVLGTLRVLLVAPVLGPLAATLLELPLMLGLSWIVCAWIIRRMAVARTWDARLWMGGTALILLLLAEALLSFAAYGLNPIQHLALYRNSDKQIGLLAQLCFGLFPLIQMRRAHP